MKNAYRELISDLNAEIDEGIEVNLLVKKLKQKRQTKLSGVQTLKKSRSWKEY